MKTQTKIKIGIGGIIVALFVGVLAMSGVFSTDGQKDTGAITIGAALGLTGDAAAWSEASFNGAKLAVAEINANGGVNGRPLELVVEDTRSTSKDTVSAVSKLQNIDHANAFLVTWLDVYQGAASLLTEGQVMLSPDAGVEAVNGEKVYPRVFSTWYRTEPKSDLIVKYMAEHGKKKLYMVAQNDSYYVTATQFMEAAAKKYGVEVIGTDLVSPNTDMKTILAKIASAKPDAVWFAFYDERSAVELMQKRSYLVSNGIEFYGDEFVQQNYTRPEFAGQFEGVYFYAPQTPDRRFFDAYTKRYGTEPVFGASTSYDAVYMLARMFRDNPKDIDAYMRSTQFDTVSYGKATFDRIGGIATPTNYFTIKRVENGKAAEAK